MILEITKYGNPVLRQKGAPVEKITPEIKKLIADMFETMYARRGVGLAAQQIGKALQLTVIDLREVKNHLSTLELNGKLTNPSKIMPLVLINPKIEAVGNSITDIEGCLSFPEIVGEVSRPEFVDVKAMNEKGKPIEFRAGGWLARAIQHEWDHLNGFLFIDRMTKRMKDEIREELNALHEATKVELENQKRLEKK